MDDLLPPPEPVDDADRKLLADIDEFGVHVVYVPPEANTPGWAFSVGLYRNYRSPEVVVFGLNRDVAHYLVNQLGSRAHTDTLAADQIHNGLIEGHPCLLRPVLPIWYREFVGYAVWYYRKRPFPLLQCFWPDHSNVFPWQSGFRSSWFWAQPLLYLADPHEARAEALLQSMAPHDAG